MRIAVTGANGFIGRHVVVELGRHDVEIVAVVRPEAPMPTQLAAHRIVACDLARAPNDIFDLLGKPDVLINLAWGGLPNYKSLHHFESELPAQYRFVNALVRAGLKSVVVAGTCFEYGMQSGPLAADAETRPCNPYGYAKDALRRQLLFLQRDLPFRLVWARLFYLYGDGQADSSLLPQLRQAVARGDKVFDMSGGEQLRDYLPVTSVASQLVRLAVAGHNSETVNICSGKPISIRRQVEKWISEYGYAIVPNLGHYPYPDYEPMAFWGIPRFPTEDEHR